MLIHQSHMRLNDRPPHLVDVDKKMTSYNHKQEKTKSIAELN